MSMISEFMKSFSKNVIIKAIEEDDGESILIGTFTVEHDMLDEVDIGIMDYKGDKYSVEILNSGETKRGFEKDPYVKVYQAEDSIKAKYMCRISLRDGKYIEHKNLRGKDRGKINKPLTSDEMRAFEKFMNTKIPGEDITYYQKSLIFSNNDNQWRYKSKRMEEEEINKYKDFKFEYKKEII